MMTASSRAVPRRVGAAATEQNPVRNGNRWRVTAINPDDNRLAAQRLHYKTIAVFDGNYVREHITHGYATTVHSTHAVLSEAATRSLFYVAISRGRDCNTAYFYERRVEREFDHQQDDGVQSAQRRTSQHASRLARAIIADHGGRAVTAHDVAAQAESVDLPASEGCLAADLPQSIVGERSTHSGGQNRVLSSTPWFRPALGMPATHENTVSTTGSTCSRSRDG
jgi:hypothetical protein